jgi:hypothetical protein
VRSTEEIRRDVDYIKSLDWVTKYDDDRIHRLVADVGPLLDEIEFLRSAYTRLEAEHDSR